jgi:hypothetical protein
MSALLEGEKEHYKKDKRGYSFTDGVDIAKLSTKTPNREPRRYAIARRDS